MSLKQFPGWRWSRHLFKAPSGHIFHQTSRTRSRVGVHLIPQGL